MKISATIRLSDRWKAAYSLEQTWRHCLGWATPCVPALLTTHSTVCHHLLSMLLLYLHTFTFSVAPHCCHVSLFLSGSSTGSVCGLDCWGAQGGSALTVGGNSFRKYQTARHTHSHTQSTISLSLSPISRLKAPAQNARVKKPKTPLSLSFSTVRLSLWRLKHKEVIWETVLFRYCLVVSGGSLHARPGVLHNPEFGWQPGILWHQLKLTLMSHLNSIINHCRARFLPLRAQPLHSD